MSGNQKAARQRLLLETYPLTDDEKAKIIRLYEVFLRSSGMERNFAWYEFMKYLKEVTSIRT